MTKKILKNSKPYSLDFTSGLKRKRGACAIAGPFYSIFEHTVPIASMLDIPVITKEPNLVFIFKHFYPKFKCELRNWSLPYIIENYSSIFYGFGIEGHPFNHQMKLKREEEPGNPIWNLPTKAIYHFHGCSDKCWFKENSHFTDVDQILFYGDRMLDLFKDINLIDKVTSYGKIGNYRYAYYKKHQAFFDTLAEKEIFSQFDKKQFTLLYAPTWMDATSATSIFKAYSYVLENLPPHYNLLLKLHPYLSQTFAHYDPKPLYKLLDKYADRPNVHLAPLFPCIYPLLNGVDAYLGDYSSVGYDALAFNLPMFFINRDKRSPTEDSSAYLLQTGTTLYPEDLKDLYPIIEKELPHDHAKYAKRRKETYEYGFGKDISYEETQERLKSFLL